MNDQNNTNSTRDNPIDGTSPTTYEEAFFNDSEAIALYDTYLMLRDVGFEATDLIPLALAIDNLTIYDGLDAERLRKELNNE